MHKEKGNSIGKGDVLMQLWAKVCSLGEVWYRTFDHHGRDYQLSLWGILTLHRFVF